MSTFPTSNQCPLSAAEAAQPIISTILADVNAIMPNFSSLVSSYRLLVGAAEEIHRIPDVCPDVFERAVRRFDNAGTLIDILLNLLCCKISFSSEFLEISCLPVDLFRLLANGTEPCDLSHRTAEQIIALEALRGALADCKKNKCFPCNQVVCPGPPAPAPTTPAPAAPSPVAVVIRSKDSSALAQKEPTIRPEVTNKEPKKSADEQLHNPSVDTPLKNLWEGAASRPQHKTSLSQTKGTTEKRDDKLKSPVRRRHI